MPTERSYAVRCEWDADAGCWFAWSEDVPGLAAGADTLEALVERLRVVVPELLEANGLLSPDEAGDFPLSIHAERHERVRRAA